MLFAFLLFGTPWFWLALALPFVFLIWFVENERAVGAALTLIIATVVFVLFGDKNLIPWITSHPILIAEYLGAYILVGIVWGFVKWFFHVLRARDRYEKVRNKFVAEADSYRTTQRRYQAENEFREKNRRRINTSETDAADKAALATAVKEALAAPIPEGFDKKLFADYAKHHAVSLGEFPPRADHNKGRIIFWMSYWPASALWTIINDPITRFYRFLYNRIGKLLEGISNSMFAKYKDELSTDEA